MTSIPLTIGEVAQCFGVETCQVRNLFKRGFLPEPARVGAYRVVPKEDLPQVEDALRKAGYWAQEVPTCT